MENESDSNNPPPRAAKSKGNVNRQLVSFIDNTSSTSESSSVVPVPDCCDPISKMTSSNYTDNDVESLPSSFSPPAAPGSPPIIINESEMDTKDGVLEKMLIDKQELEINKKELEIMLEEKNDEIKRYLSNLAKYCFLGIQINGQMYKDVIIQLFDDKAPLTCSHFRSVCTGRRGFDYQNSSFNYLVSDKYIQGGEVVAFDSDGKRIFERKKEENNELRHDQAGLLSMKKNDNTTKFIITLAQMPSLDDSHVVIGKVIDGYEIFQLINDEPVRARPYQRSTTDGSAQFPGADASFGIDVGAIPLADVLIYTCGEKE